MSQPRTVHCSSDINRAYDQVASLIRDQPGDLLQRATTSAAARAASLATSLRVDIAGLEIGVNVRLFVRRVRDVQTMAGLPALSIELAWDAIRSPALFPSMLAELKLCPVSASGTQLEVTGSYWPPLGPLGAAVDAVVGHRIAEASLRRFLDDVVSQLLGELPEAS